ncbi:hypothetical protein GJ496_007981 [Pomphorhynchus laevis]|nr:hypothetical protein GJ496_007981 [Pomphorhynchus laevis]
MRPVKHLRHLCEFGILKLFYSSKYTSYTYFKWQLQLTDFLLINGKNISPLFKVLIRRWCTQNILKLKNTDVENIKDRELYLQLKAKQNMVCKLEKSDWEQLHKQVIIRHIRNDQVDVIASFIMSPGEFDYFKLKAYKAICCSKTNHNVFDPSCFRQCITHPYLARS